MKKFFVVFSLALCFTLFAFAQDNPETQTQEKPQTQTKENTVPGDGAEEPAKLLDTGKVHVLFISPFEKDMSKPDSKRKKKRIAEIPESKLLRMQEVLQTEIQKKGLFVEVKVLRLDEKPELQDGQRGWVFGGYFMDFKKGNQAARYAFGYGAGKQKVEIMTSLIEVATSDKFHQERVVDRKVGGWYGGSSEKGLRDFAERVIRLLRKQLAAHS